MKYLLFFLLILNAHAFTPQLNRIEPRGAQVGTEVEIKLIGERLFEPQELILFQPGLTVKSLEKIDDKTTKATLTVAPDCPLGEHLMRLRCKGGVSYLRTFWVGQFPTVFEARSEDNTQDLNNTFEAPQAVALNVTVQGVADNEDADYYRVSCKKGQRLSVEIEGMRLGRILFDPYVAILDAKRFELAVSDDAVLLKRDACTQIIVPEDGDYTILIRESAYQGNGACQYRAHIGTFPRPTAVFPPGGKPGEKVELTFIGDKAGEIKKSETLAAQNYEAFAAADGLRAPSGNKIRVNDLPYLNESEPNDNLKQANPTENPPAAPIAFHGLIATEGDKDWFRFSAKKGQSLRAHVFARDLRSPLDSVIVVRNAKDNKALGNNDDATQGTPDSLLDFQIPEDGDYLITINDQLAKFGPSFTYRIEISEKKPSLSLSLPYADRNDSQKEKVIAVPRGNRLAIIPNITRQNIACDIVFEAPALPAGLSATALPVNRSLSNFPILFEAKADAAIAGGLFHFNIKDPESGLIGPFEEDIHHIELNNTGTFHSTHHEKITVAVIEEAPFHIELQNPAVPIVQNGSMDLKITASRQAGFDEKIVLVLPWKPPGIGAPNTVEIPKGQNEATMTIDAKADAPLGEWPLVITASAVTPTGPVQLSSGFATLKVAEPYLKLTIQLAATEPGKNTNLVANIEKLRDFPGEAQVTLQALPHGVTTVVGKITKDSTNVNFPLAVTADAAKGKHAGLFCQVIITENGHPIPHTLGLGGTLRIDPPAPAPKNVDPNVAKNDKPAAANPDAKPLSRLEQLRQQAK